jgi:hypothetical protein
MWRLRNLPLLAAVLGLVPAVASAGGGPPAAATGGDVAALVPSLVATRIARAEAALGRAARDADEGRTAAIPRELATARTEARYAWNATVYVIKTTPPAAAAADGGAVGSGPTYAGREDTTFAALAAYHDVVATTVGIATQVGAETPALRKSWVAAIAQSQAARNNAIRYVHKLKSPGTYPTVMPGLIPFANDEIKQIDGRLKLTGFRGSIRTTLVRARARAVTTRKLVNKYWPPVPSG